MIAKLSAPMLAPILVDEREARRLLGNVSAKSMFNWRRLADLPFVKLGNRTMYCPADLARWIEEKKHKGTTAHA
jgi:hypothetical protein